MGHHRQRRLDGTANGTSLVEYLQTVGRPIDPADPEATPMIGAVSMVTAARPR